MRNTAETSSRATPRTARRRSRLAHGEAGVDEDGRPPAPTTAQFPEEPEPRKAMESSKTALTSPCSRTRRRRARSPSRPAAAREHGARDGREDELRDPVAARDRHGLGPEVHDDHADLAAVVRVDRPDAVRERQALLQREARARAHLRLVAARDLERDARRDEGARAGKHHERLGDGGPEIRARRVSRGVERRREVPELLGHREPDRDLFPGLTPRPPRRNRPRARGRGPRPSPPGAARPRRARGAPARPRGGARRRRRPPR